MSGPAYSGTIMLRQRHALPAVREQVINTLTGANMVGVAAGSAVGGAVGHPLPLIFGFTATNLLAAASVARRALSWPRGVSLLACAALRTASRFSSPARSAPTPAF
jgi:outer membrane lipoprotein SlyB